MADVDWLDRELRHRIECVMVNPHDLGNELGLLPCTVGSLTIDYGYYTDNRCSASITTADFDQYQLGLWLRIYHVASTPAMGDVRIERGTFAIYDATISSGAGRTSVQFQMQSALGAIGEDYDAWPMTIGKGATAGKTIKAICGKCGRSYRLSPTFVDYRFTSSSALEAGKSFRSRLYAVCSASGNRMDVDAHGRITFEKYTAPSERYPSMALDVDDARSPIIDGSVSLGTSLFSRPSRSVVVYKDGDSVISAQSDVASSSKVSFERRGFTKAELHELNDLSSPKTVAHVQQLASRYLKTDSAPTETWELETLWLPLKEGDVVTFAPRRYDPLGNGKARKCLVQSVTETTARLKLYLKEV